MNSPLQKSSYMAFISYRHADNTEIDHQWATWLHQQLEVYDVPAELIGTVNLRGEIIPERIYPVFRDEVSLPAHANLTTSIVSALDDASFLIVLCSPLAVQSSYVCQEISHFKASGKAERVIAALLLGTPNASLDLAKVQIPGDARSLECFPLQLQYEISARGELLLDKRSEPLAADFRLPDGNKGMTSPSVYKRQLVKSGHDRREADRLAQTYEESLSRAKLKIIAAILGVRLDKLMARDKAYQLKLESARLARAWRVGIVVTCLFLMALVGAVFSRYQFKQAEVERNIAQQSLARFLGTEAINTDANARGSLGVLLGVEGYQLDRTSHTDGALRKALSRHLWEPLVGHKGRVSSIGLSRNGRWLASMGVDQTIRLWDLQRPQIVDQIIHKGFSGAATIAIGEDFLVSGIAGSFYITTLNQPTDKPVKINSGFNAISHLALGQDGRRLVVVSSAGQLRVWNLMDVDDSFSELVSLDKEITALAVSSNSQWLAASAAQPGIGLWQLDKPLSSPRMLESHQTEVYTIDFSDDSNWLVSGGFDPKLFQTMSLWNMNELSKNATPFATQPSMFEFAYSIESVALGTQGNPIVSSGTDGTVRITNAEDRSKDIEFSGLSSRIPSIDVAPQRWIAAAADNGNIWLLDLQGTISEPFVTGKANGFITAVAANWDGTVLVSLNTEGSVYMQYGARLRETRVLVSDADPKITLLALSQANNEEINPQLLATGDSDGTIRLLDLNYPKTSPVMLASQVGPVDLLEFDADAHHLLVVSGPSILIYDVQNHQSSSELVDPLRLALDQDERVVAMRAVGKTLHALTTKNTIISWSWPWKEDSFHRKDLEVDSTSNAAFSFDGRWLAISQGNNRVHVFSVSSPETDPLSLTVPFNGETFSASGYPVTFSPDGQWLAFAAGNNKISLWSVGSWNSVPLILRGHSSEPQPILSLAFSGDSRYLLSAGVDGRLRRWSLPETLIDHACERSGRNLTLKEWRAYWGEKEYRPTCPNLPLTDDFED